MTTFDLGTAKHELITSDQPFIMANGLGQPRCVIAFPLSPRFAFIATKGPQMEEYLVRLGVDRIATSLNESVTSQAAYAVYGRTKDHLRFVEKRLRRPDEPFCGVQVFQS